MKLPTNWKIMTVAPLALAVSVTLLSPGSRTRADVPQSYVTAGEGRLVAAAGLIEPATESRLLAATVVGRIMKMMVEEGDRVSAGDVIAEIENDDLKAQQAQAEATLAARESELLRLKTGARPQERAAARAELNEAEATAKVAASNAERNEALAVKQIVSAEAVDKSRADRDATAARRDMLAQKLALLIAPPRSEDVAIAEANRNASRGRLAEIKAQLEKTIIRAPIDGTILKLYRRTGETVTNFPPTQIVSVGDISGLRVRADIDQADVALIALGQAVWVTADAYPGKRFKGTVGHIGAQLGRKNFRDDTPQEKIDTKILEVLVDLEPGLQLPIGLPVDIRFDDASRAAKYSDARWTSSHPDANWLILRRPGG